MKIAERNQSKLDWLTQQWCILFGKKISFEEFDFLRGPFGTIGVIGHDFINWLAESENLIIDESRKPNGLLNSFEDLIPNKTELESIPNEIIDFYENTETYTLNLTVNWNPIFKFFGKTINRLFSSRINQLNIPISDDDSPLLSNRVIKLSEPKQKRKKYTIWLRTNERNQQVVYLGIYEICELNSGKKCIKAIFPLPNGNATVLLEPSISENGTLLLNSSGNQFGDPGFYFVLKDEDGSVWAKYIKSFRDRLVFRMIDGKLVAEQAMSLWKINVMTLKYSISKAMIIL